MGVALTEFMLFGLLTTPLTLQLSPRSIVVVWLSDLSLFGCFASVIIHRVRRFFEQTNYEPPVAKKAVSDVADLMGRDLRGAFGTALVSGLGALLIGVLKAVPLDLAYLLSAR